jgi:hypothetical protein
VDVGSAAGSALSLVLRRAAAWRLTAEYTPTSLDPCNQLGRFPLFYRLHVTADGTISNATAQPGTPSVDLPAGALSVDGIPLD